MSALGQTPRWKLPLLAVNQLQKDLTHNEALAMIDLLLAARVQGAPQNTPPAAPQPGQCWLVGAAPTGDWAGHGGQLAGWSDGGWRWAVPHAQMTVTAADGRRFRFDGSGWTAPPVVAAPSGGTTADSQAREAVAALIQALQGQGLLG